MTSDSSDNPLDDLKNFLEDFQDQYDSSVEVHSDVMDQSADHSEDSTEQDWELDFNYSPTDLKKHLDEYVIGQTHAKKQLSNAVCYHYHQTQRDEQFTQKKNILMIGNTGVGKTHLVEVLSDYIDVPFIKADATKFSGTGYVGKNVDSLVRELVEKSDYNVERAEHGIVFLDEIDKICASDETDRDVSGRDVQTNLLKLLEETEISLFDPSNPTSMMKGMQDVFQNSGEQSEDTVNTRRILFICSGAFPGLEDIISNRLNKGSIGFASEVESGRNVELLKECQVEDLIEFGLEAEFVGRLPVRTYLHDLDSKDLTEILEHSRSSILKQYKRDLKSYDIDVTFTDDALEEIAERAHQHDIGARGLTTTLENILFEYMHELPNLPMSSLTVDSQVVQNPKRTLYDSIIQERVPEYLTDEYSDYSSGIKLTAEAKSALLETCLEEDVLPTEYLEEILSPLHHILKMIDRDELSIDETYITDTEQAFDELFRKHYGDSDAPENPR